MCELTLLHVPCLVVALGKILLFERLFSSILYTTTFAKQSVITGGSSVLVRIAGWGWDSKYS